MSNDHFGGIFFALLIILLVLEFGMMTICERLKEIRRLLEKNHGAASAERKAAEWEK